MSFKSDIYESENLLYFKLEFLLNTIIEKWPLQYKYVDGLKLFITQNSQSLLNRKTDQD